MNVYVLCPTKLKERAQAVAKLWMARGYKMLFFQDAGTDPFTEEATLSAPYSGYWNAMNRLAGLALSFDGKFKMDACVFIGDDIEPDQHKTAGEICKEYLDRFPDGFGVMQPCGDPQGDLIDGKHNAARICGSAWFGRGWIERAYSGRGPSWDGYFHFYADEELPIVAEKLGVMWWRPDLTQFHKHWSWGHTPRQDYHVQASSKWWPIDQATYNLRKSHGFPFGGAA